MVVKQKNEYYKTLRPRTQLVGAENRLQCDLSEPYMKRKLEYAKSKPHTVNVNRADAYYTSTEFQQTQSKISTHVYPVKIPMTSNYVKSLIYYKSDAPIIMELTDYKHLKSETINGIEMVSLYHALHQYEKTYSDYTFFIYMTIL